MSTGIDIREIKNEYLQKLAEEVDVSKTIILIVMKYLFLLKKHKSKKTNILKKILQMLWDYSGHMTGQNYPGKKLAK